MSRTHGRNVIAFVVGVVFALGLAIAGMTQPQKVIGFLDPWQWDPALLFVMIGAIGVHGVAYPIIRKRASPLLDTQWYVPDCHDITSRLIVGCALFGVGWGLGGYCPGPGLAALVSGDLRSLIFVVNMLVGMHLFGSTEKWLPFKS